MWATCQDTSNYLQEELSIVIINFGEHDMHKGPFLEVWFNITKHIGNEIAQENTYVDRCRPAMISATTLDGQGA